MLFFYKKN